MKEVFIAKQLGQNSSHWYYFNTIHHDRYWFLGSIQAAIHLDTYVEAQNIIQNAGPGTFAIDKIFVKK